MTDVGTSFLRARLSTCAFLPAGWRNEYRELSPAAAIHGLEAETAALLARRWRPWLDEDDVNDAATVEIAGAGTLTGVVGLPARQARTAAAVVSPADPLAAARLLSRVAGAPSFRRLWVRADRTRRARSPPGRLAWRTVRA